MNTQVLRISDPTAFQTALQVMEEGGIIAFPTDTVYGLACPAFSHKGIEKLYQIKGREATKAIPILIGSLVQLSMIAPALPEAALNLTDHFWPGALTLVIPRSPDLPDSLSAQPTVAVRMPDHPFTLELIKQSGPLATTSANRSGQSNPLSAQDVLTQLGGMVDLVLDGGIVTGGVPSTIVDCTQKDVSIIRLGAISEEEIFLAM